MENIGIAAFQNVGANALLIHGQIATEDIVGAVNGCQLGIARILQRVDAVASQKLDDEIVERLRTRADDDLLGRDVQSAKLVEVPGDRLTQGEDAAGSGIAD